MEPSSPPSKKRGIQGSGINYWSLFSQEQEDMFESPGRGYPKTTPTRSLGRQNLRLGDYSSTQSNKDTVANEFTSLLLPSPLRSEGGREITMQRNSNTTRDIATNGFKVSTPNRSLIRGRLQTPMSSGSKKTSAALQQPLLLQSMRQWDVALPPLKKHVVDGKLVDTFRGSLYGNDRNRALPIAKRRLTIELFGQDLDTNLWGRRKRRNLSDLEKNRGSRCASGASSCGDVSRLSDPSWVLMKGASTDDLSMTKPDWMSDTDSSENGTEINGNSRRYQLAERDVVVLRVMKSRVVTQYDDEFGLGENSVSSGLRDRRWESQSISDNTMIWMAGDGDRDENVSLSSRESLVTKHVRWTELSRTRLSHVELVREDFETNEVDLKMGVGARTIVQTFRFDDLSAYSISENKQEGNALTFARLFRLLKRLEKERAQDLAAAHRCLLSERDSTRNGGMDDSTHCKSLGQESSISASIHGDLNDKIHDFDCDREKAEGDETLSILVEIVSASDLPSFGPTTSDSTHDGINPYYIGGADKKNDFFQDPEVPSTVDPYVVIRDGETEIHSTSFITDTINPIWTLPARSFCLLQSSIHDFFDSSNVLEFTVKNYNAADEIEDQTIGTAIVHKTELLNGTGERKRFQILPPPILSRKKPTMKKTATSVADAPSFLYLRYRQASTQDIEFMQNFREEVTQKSHLPLSEGVYAGETFLPPQFYSTALLDNQRKNKARENGQNSLYRVKPEPNPENVIQTEWMTKSMIEEVSKDHSVSWTMTGSGSIGKLYIEIIGCDKLAKAARGKKCNPFVNIIFEDSIVNTEVINDCFSPRWMPWSRRSFVFNMINLSSQLYVSVFDYEISEGNGDAVHDPLGRVVINLSNLQPRAIHSLTYDLYDSDKIDRQLCGKISLRVRLAIDDERKAMISELSGRDHFCVSTVNEPDSRCASYSLTNHNQPYSLNLSSLACDANEILGYCGALDPVANGLMVVLLWKGHYPLTVDLGFLQFSRMFRTVRRREIQLNIPMHSMVAFTWVTILAWDLTKLLSFFWFAIGWVFLATSEHQRRHPSPWRKPRSYAELLRTLIFHKSRYTILGPPPIRRTIHPNERLGEIERFESKQAEEAALRQKRSTTFIARPEQHQGEYAQMKDIPSVQMNSSKTNWTIQNTKAQKNHTSLDAELDPTTEAILFPIQKFFHSACFLLRICKGVILWKDTYLAFWITSLCFAASFVAFWVPWLCVIQWVFRLIVWPFFGPWMKLFDIYYFQEMKNHYRDGEKIVFQSDIDVLIDLYNRLSNGDEVSAVSKENELKSRDMKRYMFGKYSLTVPIFHSERFPFEPDLSSSSVPYNTNPRPVNITRCLHGQFLQGDMIPSRSFNSSNIEGENGEM